MAVALGNSLTLWGDLAKNLLERLGCPTNLCILGRFSHLINDQNQL